MSYPRQAGSTSNTFYVLIRSKVSTPVGMGLTGLAYNTAGLDFSYVRDGAARSAVALVTQTVTGAWASGGFVEVDATNCPGLYRIDLPDALFAAGVKTCRLLWTGANTIDDGIDMPLPNYDPLAAPLTANALADAYLDRADAIEVGLTVRQAHRLEAAAAAGKLSGATGGAGTIILRNAVADTKPRMTWIVDQFGNRLSATFDLT
jgi:hypothetical protein